jgi:hypothetical protein
LFQHGRQRGRCRRGADLAVRRGQIGQILRQLCRQKDIALLEGHGVLPLVSSTTSVRSAIVEPVLVCLRRVFTNRVPFIAFAGTGRRTFFRTDWPGVSLTGNTKVCPKSAGATATKSAASGCDEGLLIHTSKLSWLPALAAVASDAKRSV